MRREQTSLWETLFVKLIKLLFPSDTCRGPSRNHCPIFEYDLRERKNQKKVKQNNRDARNRGVSEFARWPLNRGNVCKRNGDAETVALAANNSTSARGECSSRLQTGSTWQSASVALLREIWTIEPTRLYVPFNVTLNETIGLPRRFVPILNERCLNAFERINFNENMRVCAYCKYISQSIWSFLSYHHERGGYVPQDATRHTTATW